MIKDIKKWQQFEKKLISNHRLSYEQALNLINAMWELGHELGVFPLKKPLDGIEVDIKIARILNSCSKK